MEHACRTEEDSCISICVQKSTGVDVCRMEQMRLLLIQQQQPNLLLDQVTGAMEINFISTVSVCTYPCSCCLVNVDMLKFSAPRKLWHSHSHTDSIKVLFTNVTGTGSLPFTVVCHDDERELFPFRNLTVSICARKHTVTNTNIVVLYIITIKSVKQHKLKRYACDCDTLTVCFTKQKLKETKTFVMWIKNVCLLN